MEMERIENKEAFGRGGGDRNCIPPFLSLSSIRQVGESQLPVCLVLADNSVFDERFWRGLGTQSSKATPSTGLPPSEV